MTVSPMVVQGEVWWADLGQPVGSVPGYRRPVVIVQGGLLNGSRISTVICIPLTSNLNWEAIPTCLRLPAKATGLDRDSVAQASQIMTADKNQLIEPIGRISERQLGQLLARLDVALGRSGE
ncbi:MAG: type II toxin-antitoxin system PemK/MazF family toxin [Sphingorhabdus sp.]